MLVRIPQRCSWGSHLPLSLCDLYYPPCHPHTHTDVYSWPLACCYRKIGRRLRGTHMAAKQFPIIYYVLMRSSTQSHYDASHLVDGVCVICVFYYCSVVPTLSLACPALFHRPIFITQRSRQRHRVVQSPLRKRHCVPHLPALHSARQNVIGLFFVFHLVCQQRCR